MFVVEEREGGAEDVGKAFLFTEAEKNEEMLDL